MVNPQSPPPLVKTQHGYYTYGSQISEEELGAYYANEYFQEGRGSYAITYTAEEVEYFKLKANLIYRKVSSLVSLKPGGHIVDLGCGEGWVLAEFHRHGASVLGVDFSSHGLESRNPHIIDYFKQDNIYEFLQKEKDRHGQYDVVMLGNVIEHVRDPEALLADARAIMTLGGILVVVAPNDFSPLHELLLKEEYIEQEFWLAYPDHLSYFNKNSMESLLVDCGFDLRSVVADNPIDLNLLNPNTNYIKEREKGKSTHLFRVKSDLFLAGLDVDKLLTLYETLGSMGVGRDLSYYCTLR